MDSIYKQAALYYTETGKKPTHIHLGRKQINELYDLVKYTFNMSFPDYKNSDIRVMECNVVLVDADDYIGFSYLNMNRRLTKQEALDCTIQSGEPVCQCCGVNWNNHNILCEGD